MIKGVIRRLFSNTKGFWVVPLPIGNWKDLTPASFQILAKA